MFDHRHYVPILKGKMGEYRALQYLEPALKRNLTPLFEIMPIPWDFVNEAPSKTIDEHLSRVVDNINESWGQNSPVFLDLCYIGSDERMDDGSHPLTALFNEGRDKHVSLIPVTGLGRDAEYQRAVADSFGNDQLGVCIRLEDDDFDNDDLEEDLDNLLGAFGIEPPLTHLVLDLKEISPEQPGFHARAMRNLIRYLPRLREWSTLTVTGSAFPATMAEFAPGAENRITRAEWEIWLSLVRDRGRVPRLPTFGDYTVVHPEPFEMDPRLMVLGAKVKYTHRTEWILVKGRSIRRRGARQTHDLCRALIGLPEYMGQGYSWGDNYIYECANEVVGPGNQTTWVTVGVNHHITCVVNQIATVFGP